MASTSRGTGAASRRIETVYDFIVNVAPGKRGMNQLKKYEQQFREKLGADVANSQVHMVAQVMDKKLPNAAKKTGKKMYNAMMAPFASGFVVKGFGANAELDDFILKQQQMRGVTTGLRHEVGKLRNTLLLFAFATSGVVTSFKDWFNAALKNEAALVGLKAVAISTGLSFQKLQDVSRGLEEKGFLSIQGSSASLKNLAASNLTMSETVGVLNALTDAAAFNRQGTLSMEEAIVGATQGIKNQNSIMIDNAGITKNVSVMYREYALSIGKTSGALTEAEKKQAIVNGILKEAALFSGNAEKSLTTYQGKITKFQTNLLKTKRELGGLIAPGVVEGLERLANILAETGQGEFFQFGIKFIADSFSKLTSATGYFIKALNETIKMLDRVATGFGAFPSFTKVFDSPITKLGLIILLLQRMGKYTTGMIDKLRSNTFASAFDTIEQGLLRRSVISQGIAKNLIDPELLKNNIKRQFKPVQSFIANLFQSRGNIIQAAKRTNMGTEEILKTTKQEAIIRAEMIASMKNKTAEQLVEQQLSKRLTQLATEQNRSAAQQLEYQLLINNARLMGYNILQRTVGTKTQPAGGIILTKDTDKFKTQIAGGKVDFLTDKNGKPITAAMNEAARESSSMLGKMILDWKLVGTTIKSSLLQVKLFFTNIKTGAATSAYSMNSLKLVWNSFKAAVSSTGAMIISFFSKIMIWVTIIQVAYDLLKDLFKDNSAAIREQIKLIDIETKAIDDLMLKHTQTISQYESMSKLFVTGKSGFEFIRSDQGRTLDEITKKMQNLSLEILKQEKLLKDYKAGLLSDDPKLNEEWYQGVIKALDEFKTKYNASLNEMNETTDKFNATLESSIESLYQFSTKGGGSFSNILSKSQDYLKKLREFEGDRANLQSIPISEDVSSIFSKAFGEEYTNMTMYDALKLSAKDDYYRELKKITSDKEKEILSIREKMQDLQLQNIEDSLEKQLISIKRNIEKEKSVIAQEIKKLESEKLTIAMQTAMQKNILDLFGLMGGQEVKEASKNIKEIWKEVASAGFDLSDVKIKFPDGKVLSIPVEKFGVQAKKIVDEVNAKLGELGSKVADAYNLTWSTTFFEDMRLSDSDKQELEKLIGELNALSADLSDIKISGFEDKFKDAEKELGTFLSNYTGKFNVFMRSLNSLFSQANSKLSLDESKKSLEDTSSAMTKLIKEHQESLRELGGVTETVNLESLERLVANYEDLFEQETKYSDSLSEIKSNLSGILPIQAEYFESLNELNAGLALTEHQNSKVKASIKGMGAGLEEFIDRIDKANENIREFQIKTFYSKIVKEFTDELNKLRQETDLQREAFKRLSNPDFHNFFIESEKLVQNLIAEFEKLQDASQYIDIDLSLPFEKALLGFENLEFEFGKQIDTLYTEIENKYNKINLSSVIFGLDNEQLNVIKGRTDSLLEIGRGFFSQFENEIINKINSLQMSGLYSTSDGLDQLEQLRNLLEASGVSATRFEETIKKLQIADELRMWKEVAKQFASEMVNIGYQLGQSIMENKFANDEIRREQTKTIEEIDKLYQNGEITQADRLNRINQMNHYYATQMQSTWSVVSKNVVQSTLQMVQSIMQAMATAAAAQHAATGLGGLLAGLGAALPFAGIALGIGALAALASSSQPEPEMPQFEDAQNNASKFGGTIKAEDVVITIQPTFIIEGQQVFIGSGSVVEFVDEATELMKTGIQQAIDNKEFTFDSIRSIR